MLHLMLEMEFSMPFAFLVADPFTPTLLLLALLWAGAKLGGELALRLKLPSVVGELSAGLVFSALHKYWPTFPDAGGSAEAGVLANVGVLLLMFAVGLESTVPQMLRVGLASVRVAILGIVLPVALGLTGAWFLLPAGTPGVVGLFMAACLCATSIGISVQVLREKDMAASPEGRVIVGAAVIDDVLGLLVLVAVSALVAASGTGSGLPWMSLAKSMGLALAFLALALTLGRRGTPHLFRLASRLRSEQILLPLGLALAFLLAWTGGQVGLAPIIGAYAAGLILEPATVELLEEREKHSLEELLHPLVSVLAPLFFVVIGARVDVGALLAPQSLLLATVLAGLGIIGKYFAGYGGGRGLSTSIIGWGMVPRGEVGLVFVAVGSQLSLGGKPLLTPEWEAAIVGAILLTTLAGPVGLNWVLAQRRGSPVPEEKG